MSGMVTKIIEKVRTAFCGDCDICNNTKHKEETVEVDRHILLSVYTVPGGLIVHSTPTVDGMRPFLDTLDKVPSFNGHESDNIIYKPIGILYEATAVNKKVEE